MKTQQAIDRAGGAKALADLLGISHSAVLQWGETIPKAREWQLRVLKPEWFDAKGKPLPVKSAKTGAH